MGNSKLVPYRKGKECILKQVLLTDTETNCLIYNKVEAIY